MSTFDQLLFTPIEGGNFRLRCPKCGQEDPSEVDGLTLSLLQFRGADSVCIDCSPEASEPLQIEVTHLGRVYNHLTILRGNIQTFYDNRKGKDRIPTVEAELDCLRGVLHVIECGPPEPEED